MKRSFKILLAAAILGGGLLASAFFWHRHRNEPAPTFAPPPTAQFKKELKALTREVQGMLVFERTRKDRERIPDLYTMELGFGSNRMEEPVPSISIGFPSLFR